MVPAVEDVQVHFSSSFFRYCLFRVPTVKDVKMRCGFPRHCTPTVYIKHGLCKLV